MAFGLNEAAVFDGAGFADAAVGGQAEGIGGGFDGARAEFEGADEEFVEAGVVAGAAFFGFGQVDL